MGKKGEGVRGEPPVLAGTVEYEWCYEVLYEFGMSRRIKPKEKYVCISVNEIWRNLDGPPKNKDCGAT